LQLAQNMKYVCWGENHTHYCSYFRIILRHLLLCKLHGEVWVILPLSLHLSKTCLNPLLWPNMWLKRAKNTTRVTVCHFDMQWFEYQTGLECSLTYLTMVHWFCVGWTGQSLAYFAFMSHFHLNSHTR
jgi:hypothetical protein